MTLKNSQTLSSTKNPFSKNYPFGFYRYDYESYKKWPSSVLPEEEFNIQELISQYQNSFNLEIQSLRSQIDSLTSQVDLQSEIIRELQQERKIIPIQNLRSKKIALALPLYVILEKENNVFVVSSEDLNIYGYGETELNAIRDFCKEVENLYFDLKRNRNKLSKLMKETWNFMKEIIKEKKI